MELLHWLESTVGGEFVFTFLVSMIPIVELRGGIPFGVALGLPYPVAFTAAVIGNILPAPFIIVYIRRIFQWMRRRLPRLDGLVDRLEKKASVKGDVVNRYKYLGLMLFVGIPLPGTGAGYALEKGHALHHCRSPFGGCHHDGAYLSGSGPVYYGNGVKRCRNLSI